MSDVERVLQRVDDELPRALGRLFELLSIDSISTDPAHKDSCMKAADWLVGDLCSMGFETQRHDTPGHPMVVGHQAGASDKGPHLLF